MLYFSASAHSTWHSPGSVLLRDYRIVPTDKKGGIFAWWNVFFIFNVFWKKKSLLCRFCSSLSAFIWLESVGTQTSTALSLPGYSHTAANSICSPILLKTKEVNQCVSWWPRKQGRKHSLFTTCSAWQIALSQERAYIYVSLFGFVALLSMLRVVWLGTWSRHWLRTPHLLWICL